MIPIIIGSVTAVLVIGSVTAYVLIKKRKRRNPPGYFQKEWLAVQRLCARKDSWALAVINADKLLDRALKTKRMKGKSMGERMVSAQRQIGDNDSAWFAHNMAKKLSADTGYVMRESEAKKALVGVGRVLKDMGLLRDK